MDYAERRKAQARQTESAILTAALTLMRKDGFHGVTVRDICKESGITTGAFYHHFQSKEDLFTKGFAPLDQYMEQALGNQPADDPAKRLRDILRCYTQFMEDCGELTVQYYQRRLVDPHMVTLDPSRYIFRAMTECFEQAKAQGIVATEHDAEWMADFCFRHFRGVVIDWLLHRRGYPLMDKMVDDYTLLESMFQVRSGPAREGPAATNAP